MGHLVMKSKYIEWGAVDCLVHGYQMITHEQYDREMANPDDGWRCPICARRSKWIVQDDMDGDYDSGVPPF